MAEHWWRTADGTIDRSHRERARLLKTLAEQALVRAEPLDVNDRPAAAVNDLVASETLRDLGNDRVAFRHDVLREWAIANLLHSEPETIERLNLDCPAAAVLARGVELAARLKLERADDGADWSDFSTYLAAKASTVHGDGRSCWRSLDRKSVSNC